MEEVRQQAAFQFSILLALCYGEFSNMLDVPQHLSNRNASYSAYKSKLTSINATKFRAADAEWRFIQLLLQATALGRSAPTGPGMSKYTSNFWREYQENFNLLTRDEFLLSWVRAAFGPELNVHRAKYRAVQSISEDILDGRSSGGVTGRKRQFSNAVGYTGVEDFEFRSWGFHAITGGPIRVDVQSGTARFAEKYPDDELLSEIADYNQTLPLPLLSIDDSVRSPNSPQEVNDRDDWEIAEPGKNVSKMVLAAQERVGEGYFGICFEELKEMEEISHLEHALPVDDLD